MLLPVGPDVFDRRYRELARVKPPVAGTGVPAPIYGGAENRLTASFAQAFVEALNSDPGLYVRYLKEQEAARGARRG